MQLKLKGFPWGSPKAAWRCLDIVSLLGLQGCISCVTSDVIWAPVVLLKSRRSSLGAAKGLVEPCLRRHAYGVCCKVCVVLEGVNCHSARPEVYSVSN